MAKYNWNEIEQEYITSKTTLAKLAAKHGIKPGYMEQVAQQRHFTEKRRKYQEKTMEKALEKAQARELRTREMIMVTAEKMIKQLHKSLSDDYTLHTYLYTDKKGIMHEFYSQKLDTKALRDMVAVLIDLMKLYPQRTEQATADDQCGVIEMETMQPLEE